MLIFRGLGVSGCWFRGGSPENDLFDVGHFCVCVGLPDSGSLQQLMFQVLGTDLSKNICIHIYIYIYIFFFFNIFRLYRPPNPPKTARDSFYSARPGSPQTTPIP